MYLFVLKKIKELNLFSKIYSKNCTFLFWKKSKNWTLFFSMWPKELNFFSVWLKELSPFKKYYSMNWIFFFFQYYSKTWAFFFLIIWLSRIEPFLKNMTQRIELFKCDLEPRIILQFDSNNWIWLKALNPPFEYVPKNWTLFWTWLTETYWVIITQRIVLSKNMTHKTQRIEPSFHKWLEDLTFLFQICLIEITFFFLKKRWLEELIFWKYQSNYTNFIWMTQRIEFFFFLKNMTHRNWTFFTWLKELNPFLNMTQRVEKFSWFFDSKNWTFFEYDSKIWIFSWMWLTELNFFIDSKKWVLFFFFSEWQRFCWIRLKELNPFLNMTQRIEKFSWFFDSKNWTFFCTTQRIELFSVSLKEVNFFLQLTQRIEPFF